MDTKKRAPNFSASEKVLLLNLITDFKGCIENKKTNSQTWREKDEAWQKIADRFNSENPENFPRTKDALRKFYDNIKKNVRKDVAEERRELNRTGGGGYKIKDDPVKEMALGLINTKTVFGLTNKYDSDSICEEITLPNDSEDDHGYCKSIPTTSSTVETLSEYTTDIPSCSGEQHKQPVGKKCSDSVKQVWVRRRRPVVQQLTSSKLSEEYLKLAKLKQECYEAQKESILKRTKYEEEIFELQKRKLLIEITNINNKS